MNASEPTPVPGDWTKGMEKHPGLVKWTSEQYIAQVCLNGHLIDALCDTGGEKSMIDARTAERLGLRYQRARGSEFGKYVTAGGHVQPYFGLVRGPIDAKFSA